MTGTTLLDDVSRRHRQDATEQGPEKGPLDPPTVQLLGTSVHRLTQSQCICRVMEALRRNRGGWIVTPNLDHLRRCVVSPEYGNAIGLADLRVADGMPLIWASRLRGTPLPERIAGSDLIYPLSRALATEYRSVYLLGGTPGTAEQAACTLRRMFPGLQIAGTCCPPMGFEQQPEMMRVLANKVIAAVPDVVLVALGCPKQEYLIRRLRLLLPQAWWIGVGISFSFVCGQVRRAPPWMRCCGLEWLHRLMQEPKRLWKRYLVHGLPFALLLILHALLGRARVLHLVAWLRAMQWCTEDLEAATQRAVERAGRYDLGNEYGLPLY